MKPALQRWGYYAARWALYVALLAFCIPPFVLAGACSLSPVATFAYYASTFFPYAAGVIWGIGFYERRFHPVDTPMDDVGRDRFMISVLVLVVGEVATLFPLQKSWVGEVMLASIGAGYLSIVLTSFVCSFVRSFATQWERKVAWYVAGSWLVLMAVFFFIEYKKLPDPDADPVRICHVL